MKIITKLNCFTPGSLLKISQRFCTFADLKGISNIFDFIWKCNVTHKVHPYTENKWHHHLAFPNHLAVLTPTREPLLFSRLQIPLISHQRLDHIERSYANDWEGKARSNLKVYSN